MLFDKTVDVEIEVNLDDFDTTDIIEYLEDRGYSVIGAGNESPIEETARLLYERRLRGIDVSSEIEDLFLTLANRII